MVRKLKFHEKKLLKKVDFINWEVDNNLHEVKVMRKYCIQKREDYTLYNKLSREIRETVRKIKDLDSKSQHRADLSAQMLEKMYQIGLIPTKWNLELCDKITASRYDTFNIIHFEALSSKRLSPNASSFLIYLVIKKSVYSCYLYLTF